MGVPFLATAKGDPKPIKCGQCEILICDLSQLFDIKVKPLAYLVPAYFCTRSMINTKLGETIVKLHDNRRYNAILLHCNACNQHLGYKMKSMQGSVYSDDDNKYLLFGDKIDVNIEASDLCAF